METQINKIYKFTGGIRAGFVAATWPWGILEIAENQLIVRNELTKEEFSFSKSDVKKIEEKKILPIVGYGIKIVHNNPSYKKIYIFGMLVGILVNWLKS